MNDDLTIYSLKLQDYFSNPDAAKKSKEEAKNIKNSLSEDYTGNDNYVRLIDQYEKLHKMKEVAIKKDKDNKIAD
tara:strand:- start:11 stop:235 length:225 start_codon:yes stop_codon:yes gene_type:complete